MIDFQHIEKYRENNRIEAKKALGGLPHSIWETYSAFANSFGGVILLGVEEYKDKSLHPVNLPDPEDMAEEFWRGMNNPQKVSVNILSRRNIAIHAVDGKRFLSIEVPRASRSDKPVYIDGNPMNGAYRRNGEGDYKCTRDEIAAMMRDAAVQTQDMSVLENMGTDVFHSGTVHAYRNQMKHCRPGHVWETLDDIGFLSKLGAVGIGADGMLHPTAAGLLMFGDVQEIVKAYPNYSLDYREALENDRKLSERILSSSGDWSGNVYDFYCLVYDRLTRNLDIPKQTSASVHQALGEALANCLINADYYGREGILLIRRSDSILFSNPGSFRIDIETAKNGGISDPRNAALIQMFNMADIAARTGSGIPNIFRVWKKQGWAVPEIREDIAPERITLLLHMKSGGEALSPDKKSDMERIGKPKVHKAAVMDYLTENVTADASEISELLGICDVSTENLLAGMAAEGMIVAEDTAQHRIYKLKI